MVIFLSACVDGILQLFTNFHLHRKFLIFLWNDHYCKAIEAPIFFEKLLWLLGCCIEGILQLFTDFYFHRKVLIFLRNDSDCKDVDLYNTRKRYTAMGPRGAPTTCNQHGASRSYSFGQIWADCEQIFELIPMWFLRILAF